MWPDLCVACACCHSFCALQCVAAPLCLDHSFLNILHPLWLTPSAFSSTQLSEPRGEEFEDIPFRTECSEGLSLSVHCSLRVSALVLMYCRRKLSWAKRWSMGISESYQGSLYCYVPWTEQYCLVFPKAHSLSHLSCLATRTVSDLGAAHRVGLNPIRQQVITPSNASAINVPVCHAGRPPL